MLKVYKFGGAVLNNILGFNQLRNIISSEEPDTKIILVVSAFEKTTAKLKSAAEFAEIGQIDKSAKIIDGVFSYHEKIVSELFSTEYNINRVNFFLRSKKEDLLSLMRGISITRELTSRTSDMVLSYGEIISSHIISVFLDDNNIKNIFFNISRVITTDLNFGAAVPDINITKEKINKYLFPVLENARCVVTQGFIASSYTGEMTTMGMESSNLTASILAGLLSADEFVIWTDVEGIRNADPKIFNNTVLIPNVSYILAERLAYRGFKLIYPEMISYLKKFNLEVYIKSGLNINGEYSIISKNGDGNEHTMCIHRENLSYFKKYGGHASRVFVSRKDENFVEMEIITKILKENKHVFHLSPDKSIIIFSSSDTMLENELILNNYKKIKNIYAITCINIDFSKIMTFLDVLLAANQKIFSLTFESNNDAIISFETEKNDCKLIQEIFSRVFIN